MKLEIAAAYIAICLVAGLVSDSHAHQQAVLSQSAARQESNHSSRRRVNPKGLQVWQRVDGVSHSSPL